MFTTLKYLNEKRLKDFIAIINPEKRLSLKSASIETQKNGNVGVSFFNAGIHGNTTINGEYEENLTLEYNEFESLLVGRDDFFDFTSNPDFDLSTIENGSIIKYQAPIIIPEEYDAYTIVSRLKKYLIENETGEMEKGARELLSTSLDTDDLKIPIYMECEDDKFLASKIMKSMLKVQYEEFEDFENDDYNIVAKVNNKKKGSVEIYDPCKDFLSLGRSLRRTMKKENNELASIILNGEVINIEVIAIYN